MKKLLVAVVFVTALFAAQNANGQDIDPDKVTVPNNYQKSEWHEESTCFARKIKWNGEYTEGYIYRDEDGDIYIQYGGWLGTKQYYYTEEDAINALYVEKKYNKLRRKGRNNSKSETW